MSTAALSTRVFNEDVAPVLAAQVSFDGANPASFLSFLPGDGEIHRGRR